jgi:hypothetical protein
MAQRSIRLSHRGRKVIDQKKQIVRWSKVYTNFVTTQLYSQMVTMQPNRIADLHHSQYGGRGRMGSPFPRLPTYFFPDSPLFFTLTHQLNPFSIVQYFDQSSGTSTGQQSTEEIPTKKEGEWATCPAS